MKDRDILTWIDTYCTDRCYEDTRCATITDREHYLTDIRNYIRNNIEKEDDLKSRVEALEKTLELYRSHYPVPERKS